MKKWIISFVVFILSLASTVFIGFYAGIFLIGPHSDILPEIIHIPAGLILLTIIIGIPLWLGRVTFIQISQKEKSKHSN